VVGRFVVLVIIAVGTTLVLRPAGGSWRPAAQKADLETEVVTAQGATEVAQPVEAQQPAPARPTSPASNPAQGTTTGPPPAPRGAFSPSRPPSKPPRVTSNTIGMKLALLPADGFLMGSSASESDADPDERPQHPVRITRPFFLGICEVTQQEYQRVMGENPSSEQTSPRQPVANVSWFDAVRFCNRLSEKENLSPYCEVSGETVKVFGGDGYRLPTEAEWEYACRAGSTTKWSSGNDVQRLARYAWLKGNTGDTSQPVGQKTPNAFGLYDMHGHLWEWCWDWYGNDYYKQSPVDDPPGPSSGSLRVERGGDAWGHDPPHLRSAFRKHLFPTRRFRDLGFRVARTGGMQEAPSAPDVADRGQPAEASPTQILKNRGLEWQRGTPSTWVLKQEEAAALARFRSAQAQEKQLASARRAQSQLAAGSQNRQALSAAYQAQIDALDMQTTQIDQQLAALGPSIGNATADNYHNLPVQQHNTIVGQRRRLSTMVSSLSQQGGDFQEQLRQFGQEVEELAESYRQAVEEARELVAEINKRYEELGTDEEITKALADLSATTKAKQRAGPSKELNDVIRALARADGSNRARMPAKKGRKPD
jgi:formylglycine-generating enzyme required for sulfatase activity